MPGQIHSMQDLFKQLGLPDSEEKIDEFIRQNSPLPRNIDLHKAPFWSASQAEFILSAKQNDADWSILVDDLDELLRG